MNGASKSSVSGKRTGRSRLQRMERKPVGFCTASRKQPARTDCVPTTISNMCWKQWFRTWMIKPQIFWKSWCRGQKASRKYAGQKKNERRKIRSLFLLSTGDLPFTDKWRLADTFVCGRGVPIGNFVRPDLHFKGKEQGRIDLTLTWWIGIC